MINDLKNIGMLAAEILMSISDRYVADDKTIPENVLKLKDEVMHIYERSLTMSDANTLEQYGKRLEEIKEELGY